jgi:hypothetical protein
MVKLSRDKDMLKACFSLSQTERRLAWRAKREALEWQAKGHTLNYLDLVRQSDDYWRKAKWYLNRCRHYRSA